MAACVLFDLDGTLADTLPGVMAAVNLTLAEAGRAEASRDEVRSWIGDGVAKLVERAFAAKGGLAEGEFARRLDRFAAFYEGEAAKGSRAFPGAVEALRDLHRARFRLGVCTNKPTAAAEDVVRALGMRGFLHAVTGADRVSARKPHPAHVLEALAEAGGEAGRALMVGDSLNDVTAGHAAGLPVVLVAFGYAHGPVGELGAEAVIEDFVALPALAVRMLE